MSAQTVDSRGAGARPPGIQLSMRPGKRTTARMLKLTGRDAGEARARLAADHQALGLPNQRNNKVFHAANIANGKKKFKTLKVYILAELVSPKKSLNIPS